MKQKAKSHVLNILFRLKILGKVYLGLKIINFIFQRVFMINAKFKIPVHFTTKINVAKKISFHSDENTLTSFAVSGCCYIQAFNGIELGQNILFSKGLNLISANHNKSNFGTWDQVDPIIIGHNVWIGVNVTILPGVTIGDNCTIGAGSIVTKSFKENDLVIAGNPAKVINKKSR